MIPVTVTFYGDVGFDRSYNHVIDFSNETERENYFSSRIVKTVQDCAYNKPMNSLQIRCPYEDALNFTYCKFIIGSNQNSQKKIYAWVDDVILLTDQKDENNVFIPVLQINISIDPWQTFLFNFTVGESFVAREHVDRFKDNGDGTRGWCLDNISDVSSLGLQIRKKDLINLQKPSAQIFGHKVYWFLIQITELISGSNNNRMKCLLIPTVVNGLSYAKIVNTIFSLGTVSSFFDDSYLTIYGLDAQRIANVSYIPYDVMGIEHDSWQGNNEVFRFVAPENYKNNYPQFARDYNGKLVYEGTGIIDVSDGNDKVVVSGDYTFTESVGLEVPVDDIYSINHEPQLFKNPYNYVSIINESGIEVGQLPSICANIQDGFNKVRIRVLIDSVEVRIRIIPLFSNGIEMDSKYWVEFVATRVDVLSNQWLSFLLQERETTRQMISSQVSQQAIASAIGGVSSAVGMGGQQAMSVGKSQVGQSELGAFGAGAVVGLGVGAIQTVGGYIANKHFAFEQQDIREKAIKRKANNLISGGTFRSAINCLRIVLVTCDATTLDIKAKEFHKYGYSVFFYETPNLKSRKYFNFIATNIVKIEGSLNNQIKMALSEIFNNGVTIWHGDYINELTGIGDYSKENIERSLL